MPTYEYRCPKGHTFEVFQKMSDPPIATCTHCGDSAERVLSGGAGFLFKGEGFYITGNRSEDYKKKAEAESGITGGKPRKARGAPEPSPKVVSPGTGSGKSSESGSGSSGSGSSSPDSGGSGSSGGES